MDWNSDGGWDVISGDRNGFLNVFIRLDTILTGYKQYKLIDNTVLDVGSNSEPNTFDWNGDGKKDLVIGAEAGGIRVYLNQGDDSWPMFQAYFLVYAGGSLINFNRPNPYLFDLDGDSRKDLVCGEQNGYVHYYQNLGPDSAPVFARGETLKLESGAPVRWTRTAYYYGSRCGFGDWNNDGTPDFLLSTYEGQIELYLGVPLTGIEEGRPVSPRGLRVSPVPGRPPITVASGGPLEVTDGSGRVVRLLQAHSVECGASSVTWDGADEAGRRLPAGVYFCRVRGSGEAGRIVLAR